MKVVKTLEEFEFEFENSFLEKIGQETLFIVTQTFKKNSAFDSSKKVFCK